MCVFATSPLSEKRMCEKARSIYLKGRILHNAGDDVKYEAMSASYAERQRSFMCGF